MSTLLVPDLRRGHGTGHLRRCLKLLATLPDASIYLPEHGSALLRGRDELGDLVSHLSADLIANTAPNDAERVVLDLFTLSKEEALSYGKAVTIGLDLGGEGRDYCSYLIDSLPRINRDLTNISDLGLLDLPKHRSISDSARNRLLVTFGGEDPAALTESTAAILVGDLGISPGLITVVQPALRTIGRLPAGVRSVPPVDSLMPLMVDHEWIITSHGMTALEAAAAGRLVITVNPTAYHDRLAAGTGFVRAGIKAPNSRKLASALADRDSAARASAAFQVAKSIDLAEVVSGLGGGHTGCPAHAGSRGVAIWRSSEKSYFRCPECGVVYLERFRTDREEYGVAYFEDEYKAQYGKSYLDDFASIKEAGLKRMGHIRSLRPEAGALLDIGCAYGPFLQAAADDGMRPHGIDVSASAIDHVKNVLGFPAVAASVLEAEPALHFDTKQFDVVTMWYVIEHFQELDDLLKKVSGWIRPGGVFAFSTPNMRGVSGRRNREEFLSGSPRDHHTILDPKSAREVIRRHGFRTERVVSTGHHPERYPAVRKHRLPARLAGVHSRLFGWGDTFELYAKFVGPDLEQQGE